MTDEIIQANSPSSQRERLESTIGKLTAGLVTFLAVAAFGLSFEALRDLAIVSGGMKKGVAWLFPLIVDGGIIVFSLGALRANVTGSRDRRWFVGLVIVVTLFSVVLNVAHSKGGAVPALIASVPPVLLFLAFESLMRQCQGLFPQQFPVKRPTRPKPSDARTTSPSPSDGAADRQKQAVAMAERGISRNQIARDVKMSPATVRRYLKPVGLS
ncbi:MAG: DUF2637 domain-containing protein [Verrucomicrobiaceae bacterium]|nr:MAG: DUF2637 domain-containing protein [Verrucomicrobiaceae bacterium]